MNINIAELRAIQQAATPGPYTSGHPKSGATGNVYDSDGDAVATCYTMPRGKVLDVISAAYFAAFNPELTGELLDTLEQYKRGIMHLTGWTAEELPERMVEVASWAILRARNTSAALNSHGGQE